MTTAFKTMTKEEQSDLITNHFMSSFEIMEEMAQEGYEHSEENLAEFMEEVSKRLEAKKIAELTNEQKREIIAQEQERLQENYTEVLIEALLSLLEFKGIISREEMEMAIQTEMKMRVNQLAEKLNIDFRY